MKKLFTIALAIGLFAFVANASAQEKYVAGGFEMAGHIMAGGGYQHHNNKATTYGTFDGDIAYTSGPMGKYMNTPGVIPAPSEDYLSFFVDEVELDIMKSFGENVRLRADLDFARVNSGGAGMAGFVLEQAYATANIPVGNGIEFLLGRFNTPIGFEAVDVIDNDTISKSVISTGLRSTNTTGLKIYYAFSDLVDFHFYIVNTLTQDSDIKVNDVPSFGMRLGFNWGEEGSESTFGISGQFGPETRLSNKHFTYLGDLDLSWWITEAFNLGVEGIFRRDNAFGGSNTEYMGGLLNLKYVFSDVWDGTLRYVFAKQFDPGNLAVSLPLTPANLTGAEQSMHQITLAINYAIADGAKFRVEPRFDIVNPAGGGNTEYVFGGALAFGYEF
ncbi:MAG: outer membrane beta-barrel protein [Proteobacteria bacterium]|nr:outer membrane beta-barrel protein [Pseudomonadota bacterium]